MWLIKTLFFRSSNFIWPCLYHLKHLSSYAKSLTLSPYNVGLFYTRYKIREGIFLFVCVYYRAFSALSSSLLISWAAKGSHNQVSAAGPAIVTESSQQGQPLMSKHTSVCSRTFINTYISDPNWVTNKKWHTWHRSWQLIRFQCQLRFWFPTIIKKDNQGKMIIIPNVTVWRQVLCSTAVPEQFPE